MTQKPPQEDFDVAKHPNWNGANRKIECQLRCLENAEVGGAVIPLLFYIENRYTGFDSISDGSVKQFDRKIPFDQDCVIEFDVAALSDGGTLAFRTSNKFFFVTQKARHSDGTYRLYSTDNGSMRHTLYAKAKRGRVVEHGVNFNVEMFQGRDEAGGDIWLPMTLDPEIINPRPPEQIAAADTKLIPQNAQLEIMVIARAE
jgi:hypothetical protein